MAKAKPKNRVFEGLLKLSRKKVIVVVALYGGCSVRGTVRKRSSFTAFVGSWIIHSKQVRTWEIVKK